MTKKHRTYRKIKRGYEFNNIKRKRKKEIGGKMYSIDDNFTLATEGI